MASTFQSSALNFSLFAENSAMRSSVFGDRGSGLCTTMTEKYATNSSTSAMGVQMTAQSRNEIWMPVLASSIPIAMMFMELPDGRACPPMQAAYGMAIMSARPKRDFPGSAPSICRMLLEAMPAKSALQGKSDMNIEHMNVAAMKAKMTSFSLPFVNLSRNETMRIGILVFNRAAESPNEASTKKMTLLTHASHTVVPSLAENGRMPNTGSDIMMAMPVMAKGTGSATHKMMPAISRARLIFPGNESPSGNGSANAMTMMPMATRTHAIRAATDLSFNIVFSPPH
nr:hypothetical protein [Raoultibacter timonensis]